MLTFDEAKQQLLGAIAQSAAGIETIPVARVLGRILAEDVFALCDVPPQNNSAMDGFAVRCADIPASATLPVSQKIFAGAAPAPMQANTAVRLFTGSVVPDEADAVILQEDCTYDETSVTINELPRVGQHIRRQGEDIKKGALLLGKGVRLQPKHIGYMVAGGIASVNVYKALSVGLLATGDELKEPGTDLAVGQIFNSNLYMLQAELQALGFVVEACFVRDDLPLIAEAFARLCTNNDVVLSIGGVSVGDADLVKQAIGQLGEMQLWKVSMKPGKPLSFGKVLDKPVIGLPGNPVSAFATFHLFAKPFLLKLQGLQASPLVDKKYPVKLDKAMNPKREEFLRVQLQVIDGVEWLVPFAHQGSGVLSSVVWATGFARIPQDAITRDGDNVVYIPF
jgi:molybdopterin molybdotransferase